jgi:hypothetical protein
MKRFKEYIDLKEEVEYAEQILNEDPFVIAGAILGYAGAGLLVGWAGALILTGYAKLATKFINGVKKAYKRFIKKDMSSEKISKSIKKLKGDSKVQIQKNKMMEEEGKYVNEFKDVFEAIKKKDAGVAAAKIKDIKLDRNLINRMVILETTKAFGEPPLHYGNTGNDAYLFIKKVLGIKVAQAASFVVKKAFETKGAELVKDVEKDEKE